MKDNRVNTWRVHAFTRACWVSVLATASFAAPGEEQSDSRNVAWDGGAAVSREPVILGPPPTPDFLSDSVEMLPEGVPIVIFRVDDDATRAATASSAVADPVSAFVFRQNNDSSWFFPQKSSDDGNFVANQLLFGNGWTQGGLITGYELLVYNSAADSGTATVEVSLWDGDPLGQVDVTCATDGIPALIPGTTATFTDLPQGDDLCPSIQEDDSPCVGLYRLTATLDPPVPVDCDGVWMVLRVVEGCRLGWRINGFVQGDGTVLDWQAFPEVGTSDYVEYAQANGQFSWDGVGTCCDTGEACDHTNASTADDCVHGSFCGQGVTDVEDAFAFEGGGEYASLVASVMTEPRVTVSVVPVGNHSDGTVDPGVVIEGNEITMPSGGRYVFLELRISDWDPDDTGVQLFAFQWHISAGGYTNEFFVPVVRAELPCDSEADCDSAFGDASECGPNLAPCFSDPCCTPSFIDESREDFVMFGEFTICSVDLSTPSTRAGCTAFLQAVDDPEPFPEEGLYAGTLIIDVPPDAKGTFTAPLLLPHNTALADQDSEFIAPLAVVGATVTIPAGRCCYDLENSPQCADPVTSVECEALPGPRAFIPGETCDEPCTDCNQNGLIDSIEIENEPAYDCNRNGALDVCEKGATDPLLFVPKSRYLTIPTADLTGDVAIRVTFDDLAAPADVFNGQSMWVDTPFERSIHGHIAEPVPGYPNFKTATLRCDEAYATFGEASVVEVHDEFIIPSSTYTIEVFDLSGPGGTPAPVGEPSTIVTGRWGDATEQFDATTGVWTEPDGFVHVVTDIVALLESFRSWVCAPRKVRVDFSPALPDGEVDILDAVYAIDAFQGMLYPFAPTESPCP